jgi:AcrR family transcriptional regulator
MSNSIDMADERDALAGIRSAAAIDGLLRAAARVLIDEGLPGFNTNSIARAAGVSVATLYQHFPNKVAVLREMFERNEAARTNWSLKQMDDLATTEDLAGWLKRMGEGLRAFRRAELAGVELRRACRAIPELIQLEHARTGMAARLMANALAERMPHLSDQRAMDAARVITTITAVSLDEMASESEADVERLAAELELLIGGYLRLLAS